MALEQEPDPLRRIPVKHTADLKAEIGSVLRAARLKRGQSLEAVAQQTRISKRFLEALENDRFEQFPAVVYLRGFLKGYCEHLEVDFEALWAKLEEAQAAAAPAADPNAPAAAPASKEPPHAFTAAGRASLHTHPTPANPATHTSAGAAAAKAPTPAPAEAAPAKKEAAHRAPAAHAPAHHAPAHADAHAHAAAHHGGGGATGAIVLAVVLGLGLAVWVYKDQSKPAAVVQTTAPVALQPLPRAVEPKLVIKLKNDAWLSVSLDGQTVFEGRAPRGAAQEWKPAKTAILRTTEPAALELELNGAVLPLPEPGPDGEYKVEIP